jgi:anti-anti-sigma factor
MNISVEKSGKRLSLAGEMTVESALQLKNRIVDAIERTAELTLRLSDVTAIDTAGMQLLLMARQHARQAGKRVRFEVPSQAILDLVSLYNLGELLDDTAAADGGKTA